PRASGLWSLFSFHSLVVCCGYYLVTKTHTSLRPCRASRKHLGLHAHGLPTTTKNSYVHWIFNATRKAVQKRSSAASVNCVVVNKSSTTIQTRIRIPRKSGAMGSTG